MEMNGIYINSRELTILESPLRKYHIHCINMKVKYQNDCYNIRYDI